MAAAKKKKSVAKKQPAAKQKPAARKQKAKKPAAARKAAAKKPVAAAKKQKAVAKKPSAKKPSAKKPSAKKPSKKPSAKKPVAKKPAAKPVSTAPQLDFGFSISVVEIDPASFPDDLKADALELVPIVRELRELASTKGKQIRVGPPTTRDRVQTLATHYAATLLPDYTALMMLSDGIFVEDSFRLYSIDELVSEKLTKRSTKLRGGYSDCLPIGIYQKHGGWLFVMSKWGEPYQEQIAGFKVARKKLKEILDMMLEEARQLA